MKKQKFNHMLALVSTMTLAAGSHAVYAQQAADAEEIVITGFKASMEKSLELKKNSESIVEAVSSEDIGKLPDRSIAESLSRLPGLATQRVNGRAQIISIRGMGPDFNTTLLNGRQQVNTGDNRSVEFDQYPSEFISSAVVYKTPDSTVIGQGLGGTVDMQTIKPLKYGKQAIVGSVTLEKNSIDSLNSDVSNQGNRASLSYVDQFADNTVGVALAVTHMDSPQQIQHFNSWGYPTLSGGEYIIGGAKPFVQSDTVKRDSVLGTIEYTPSDSFTTSVDMFYSKFKEDNVKRGIEIPLQWSGAHLEPGYTVTDGVVSSGTFSNVNGVIRSDGEFRDASVYAVGWNTKFDMGAGWTAHTDISTSHADREDDIFESYSGQFAGPDTLTFTKTNKGYVFGSQLDYSNKDQVKLGNLQGWGGSWVNGGQQGYYKRPNVKDDLSQIKLSVDHELDNNFFKKVELGVNYDTRKKDKSTSPEYYLDFNGATSAPLPANTFGTNLSFLGFQSIIGYDPLQPFNDGTYRKIEGSERSDVADKAWTVEENVKTFFMKLNLESEVFSVPMTGNLGAQWVGTDQSSDAVFATGSNAPGQAVKDYTATPVHGGAKYNNFLPSLNLNFQLTDADAVRFGLAKTLTRSRMDNLRASASYGLSSRFEQLQETSNINNSPWSASAGNPNLRPWLADSADLSYEHYFAEQKGYYSIATYYKDINSYVLNRSVVTDFSGLPYDPALAPKMFLGLSTVPVNAPGGVVKGIEGSLSLTGEMISDALSGFGLSMSSSYTESDIKTGQDQSRMEGLSKNVNNVTFFYEKNGFRVRVSENYRSSFLGELAGFDARRNQKVVDATQTVDASIGYDFEGGQLDGLSIALEGVNLTDEPLVTYQGGNKNLISDYDSYGATYSLRLTYKIK